MNKRTDTHIHASQYPNVGIFGNSTLLDWLNKYTFPMESFLSDLNRAEKVYTRCVLRTISHGTTTAAYYATRDPDSTNLLADICLSIGQRALIGRCVMDEMAPSYYIDSSPASSLAETKATIEHIQRIDPEGRLIRPIITPRFAPSCSRECLRLLGELHQETKLPVQTHIAETEAECDMVRELFPECSSYASVYDDYGLLTAQTILAHAIHLTDSERDLIKRKGAKVSHCPVSNMALGSGMARVRWLLQAGISVGLGTDVSGGHSTSILEAARQACLISRLVALSESTDADADAAATTDYDHESNEDRKNKNKTKKVKGERGEGDDGGDGGEEGIDGDDGGGGGGEEAKLSVSEVLYLATRGGADVVGLGDKIGSFQVGMKWDAQLIDLGEPITEMNHTITNRDDDNNDNDNDGDDDDDSDDEEEDDNPIDIFEWESWHEKVAKWVFGGDDRNTRQVWVEGRLIHSKHKRKK